MFLSFLSQDHVVQKFVKQEDVNVLHRAAVGLTAGGIASFMCCPIEVNISLLLFSCFVFIRCFDCATSF